MLPQEAHNGVWLLKDIGSPTALLGCGTCLDRQACGGLHLSNGSAMLTCMDLCRCADPDTCDMVCPKASTRFAKRVHEVRGFQLDDIPRRNFDVLPAPSGCVTLIEGRVSRRRPIELPDYAAIPLSRAITGRGLQQRAKTRDELVRDHGVLPRKGWIVTGIEDDRYVERAWRLPKHREVFKSLCEAGVVFATSPNFSLYADVPRHDNLHAMKRIAWMWYVMNAAGLPTALHVNGRTSHDFDRWTQFIIDHPEVTSIAFEFLTGAKLADDSERYVERLSTLAQRIDRPLTLVLRGSMQLAKRLEGVFDQVLWLDATPYFRAMHRHVAVPSSTGPLKYAPRGGDSAAPIGGLFKSLTMAAQRRYHSYRAELPIPAQRSLDLWPPSAPSNMSTDDEATQMLLFPRHPAS